MIGKLFTLQVEELWKKNCTDTKKLCKTKKDKISSAAKLFCIAFSILCLIFIFNFIRSHILGRLPNKQSLHQVMGARLCVREHYHAFLVMHMDDRAYARLTRGKPLLPLFLLAVDILSEGAYTAQNISLFAL